MTILIAWVSYDNDGCASALNFASDSRFTWGHKNKRWDFGRKLYWCQTSADLFGYAGDVVTQSTMLSQISDIIDYSALSTTNLSADERHQVFLDLMKSAVAGQINVPKGDLIFFHGARVGEGDESKFLLWQTNYDSGGNWIDKELDLPFKIKQGSFDESTTFSAGSCAGTFGNFLYQNTKKYDSTVKSIFKSLVDTIGDNGDGMSGGAPQVISLTKLSPAKPIGISIGGERYLTGMPLGAFGCSGNIEWRNDKYEFLNPASLQRESNAQRHTFLK